LLEKYGGRLLIIIFNGRRPGSRSRSYRTGAGVFQDPVPANGRMAWNYFKKKRLPMNILALLTNTDLFGQFSDNSKKLIAAIARPGEYAKNQELFMEGEKGEALYLLATGMVQLTKESGDGERGVVVKSVRQGELFAEVILFEQDRYPVTAVAIKKSICIAIAKKKFMTLLDNAAFRDEFIRLLLRKQRYLTERLRSLVTMEADDKLFHYLRQHYGPKERIVPGISKKDFAAAIDATPETLSRVLLKLGEKGVLSWKGKEIVIQKGFWEKYGG
jgi:CRP-like cAMP-binding protein